MAWRDTRRGAKTIALSMACVVLGVAAVVAAYSFRDNVHSSIRTQSKTLLGADLAVDSREPFSADAEGLIKRLGGEQARQIGFSSMAYFPASGSSRLVQVRAIDRNFPFYGVLETDPSTAAKDFVAGPGALVDETLMLQFGARVGDRLKIGDQELRIAGKLRKIPGESLAFSLLSPRIYIPISAVDQKELSQRGSLVRYRVYFQFEPGFDVDQLVQQLSPQLARLQLQADTVTRRMQAISSSIENLSRYLRLAVFVAIMLAGIGVASGIYVYTRQKIFSVATLRCIGATPIEPVHVYLIQALAIGLFGSVLGVIVGLTLQSTLPLALRDFLPVNPAVSLSVPGIIVGMIIGVSTAVMFSLLPLVSLRRVSPMLALRSSFEDVEGTGDPVRGLILCAIAAAILLFAWHTTGRWSHAVWFTGGVLVAFGFLVMVGRGVSFLMKRVVPGFLPFPWRQGLANLHRPDNQTTAVMLSLGFGAFLLITLTNIESMLVDQISARGGKGEPNFVLFDIQRDQTTAVENLLRSFNIRHFEQVPIVTLRLAGIKGRSVEEIRVDPKTSIPAWALRREYRSTYRNRLSATEQIIAGRWHGRVTAETEPIPVSLEDGIAQTLGVTIGDQLHFELQGVPLLTRVASLREVDWQRVQPNFFVVFPEGVLEDAPQFYALVTRAASSEQSANLQRAVVERFPNVSMIDLNLVLTTLDSILDRVSGALRFIALFTLFTGLAVITSAVLVNRAQRLRESILLRTLGARQSQLIHTIVAEYLFLGTIACMASVLLALAAGLALGHYFFGVVATLPWRPTISIVGLVTAGAVIIGVVGSWGIFRRPPIEALRAET